jgi:hypothetical protein
LDFWALWNNIYWIFGPYGIIFIGFLGLMEYLLDFWALWNNIYWIFGPYGTFTAMYVCHSGVIHQLVSLPFAYQSYLP